MLHNKVDTSTSLKQTVIKLQSELLATKDEHLSLLKVTVNESVKDTMIAEINPLVPLSRIILRRRKLLMQKL